MAELQKDPITRKDFLGFGVLGAIVGAILTIPPAAFILGPIVKTDVLGRTDVPDEWLRVGSISDIPEGEPEVFRVNFPVNQIYGDRNIQEESGVSDASFVVENAIWVSWKAPVLEEGIQGSVGDTLGESEAPAFVREGIEPPLSQDQIDEAQEALNVLSSSCAHLGCPVRWQVNEGRGLFLCPCHGGLYDINGGWYGGPPPRGLYRYTYEVREDGDIYVKHEFDVGGNQGPQEPYVI